ncbi:LytR family transcriptional attenuator [Amycolatopsis sulphurea]|uniref:LytR family transcriptional attenuator n=1 Tax=Amycolatopsis sulphurea TaxID=76022 RepID=A0A2A9F7R6_9PSEU|nr:LytR family transcriptional attenuator [Amycolatopsis sulphurea]
MDEERENPDRPDHGPAPAHPDAATPPGSSGRPADEGGSTGQAGAKDPKSADRPVNAPGTPGPSPETTSPRHAKPEGAETGHDLAELPVAGDNDATVGITEATGEQPHRRPGRAGRAGRVTRRIALGLASVLALGATGYAYVTKDRLQNNVSTTDVLTPRPGEPPAPSANDGGTDILLVGSDARTDAQGNALPPKMLKSLRTEEKAGINTDTIILLRFPRNGGKPSGISIPRDSWVTVPGRGQSKINSAYGVAKAAAENEQRAQGEHDQAKLERDSDAAGRRVLLQAVQDLTQVRVDHYAEVNLLGFSLLTEALGGVQVCLNHATTDKDSGANFTRGVQTVSGGEALSFVRQRKNLPNGDLDRIKRQQAFLTSALRKVLSAGTLTDPGTLNNLMDAAHRSIVLDEGLDVLDFARQLKSLASGDLTFTTIPVVTTNGRSPDGQSIVEVDPDQVRKFVAGLAGRAPSGGGGAAGAPVGQGDSGVPGLPCVD